VRRAHFLRANKGCDSPQNILIVDTETFPLRRDDGSMTHQLNFGWWCYSRTRLTGDWTEPEWGRFETPSAFWDAVEFRTRAKTRLYVFAHNVGFDGPVLHLFDELPKRGWSLAKAVIEGPPTILKWRKENATLEVLDTLNWWRMPLASIGSSLGIPKLPMPDSSASREQWDIYCRRDVEVLFRTVRGWIDFLRAHDLGGFAPTIAGQALRSYRHRFMRHEILIDDNVSAVDLARRSYFGGRVECFRIGRVKGPVHCLDVTSMYPAVMQSQDFPTVLRLHCRRPSRHEMTRWLDQYCVVASVRLLAKEPRYARVAGNRLTFPIGRVRAVLTTPDLVTAYSRGEVEGVDEVAIYDKAPIFRAFVDECYAFRRQALEAGNSTDAWLFKWLLNSLYGKFGQRNDDWTTIAQTEDLTPATWIGYDYETGDVEKYRRIGGIVQRRIAAREAHDSHPAIAAHVTAYGRAMLWDLVTRAGRNAVVYCDTDSIYVAGSLRKDIQDRIDPHTLGSLKHEATYPWLIIHGCKDYETPKGKVIKGVRSKAEWINESTVRQERWSSLKGLLLAGTLSAPSTGPIVKHLSREYTKGTVGRDGRVAPPVAEDW
jgi:DNA polymerase family B